MARYQITRRAITDDELLEAWGEEVATGYRFVPATISARMLSDPAGEGFVMMRRLNDFWTNYDQNETWLVHFHTEADAVGFKLAWADVIISSVEIADT